MEISGTIIKSLPSQQGQGAKGPWIKRAFVIQTMGQYPKEVAIEVWNDKGDVLKGLKAGQEVKISFDLSSRESNSKYYTSVSAYKIEPVGDTPVGAPKAKPPVQQTQRFEPEPAFDDSDELPF